MLTPDALINCTQVLGQDLIKKGGVAPGAFLQFANEDLAEEDCLRRRINALSSAKRALHLDVELLTDALGFSRSKPRKDNFPSRLEFAAGCGVVAPNIVKKVNQLRNEVEHDYAQPDRGVVEDYVGVVQLFVAACDPLVRSFPMMREFDHGSERPHVVHTVAGSGCIDVFESTNLELIRLCGDGDVIPADAMQPVLRIQADTPEFLAWARVLLGR
jgi:hypothetical protein